MDLKPVISSRKSSLNSSSASAREENLEGEQEDPYSLNTPSNALLGLAIAVATIAVPFGAVLNENSFRESSIVPAALESDGSKTPPPITLTRVGESDR